MKRKALRERAIRRQAQLSQSSLSSLMSSTGGGADGRSDWAGDFACVECGRKRLTAAAFSKRSIERHRTANVPLKCTACVEAAAAKERAAAAAKAAAAPAPADGGGGEVVCSACCKPRPAGDFTRAQLQKGAKARCGDCVAAAGAAAAAAPSDAWEARYKEAKEAARKAEAVGTAAARLAAASKVAALEGERVTGLKPVVLGRGGRGRGSWRGRGGTRGQA